MSSLNVKYNNDKSRDFTNPTLPAGDEGQLPPLAGALGNGIGADLLLLATQPRLARERLAGRFPSSTDLILTYLFIHLYIQLLSRSGWQNTFFKANL